MKYKERLKKVKTINLILKIVGIVLFVLLVGYILYVGINNKNIDLESITNKLFPITTILIIIFLVLLFTLGPILNTRYIKNIKTNYEKRRFKYVDTFFYKEWHAQGGDYTGHSEFTFYHVIEDIESQKLYVLFKDE